MEYNGGFRLAIDMDLVFCKSSYLFIKLSPMVGSLSFFLILMPFTHWFFSLVENPLMDFGVWSQFQGQSMPQLNYIILNQLKKIFRSKHTLLSHKMRFKPFFPFLLARI